MSIGVTFDEFWYGDPCRLKYYEKRYKAIRNRENENLWLQGRYNFVALSTALANAFRSKGSKAHDYPNEPFRIFPKTKEEEEMDAERMRAKVIENLKAFKASWDRRQNEDSRP